MRNKVRNAKRAGITVEVALAALLSVTVLILVLGLFSQNLQVMAANSNINNLFNNSNRISNSGFNRDYSKSVVNVTTSQQSVGTVGDQGIQKYHTDAQDAINKLLAKPQPLTDPSDIANLAKYLTLLAMSAQNDPMDEIKPYASLQQTYGIEVKTYQATPEANYTSISGKPTIFWGNDISGKDISVTYSTTTPEDLKSRVAILYTISGESGFN